MEAQEIENYLAELGADLQVQGINKPVRMLIIGGAYMLLLAHAPRSTEDVDIFWLEEGEEYAKSFRALRESILTITRRHLLATNWFNYLTQMFMHDKIVMPEVKLWKQFGPLHIHVPPNEYILALKIFAGRRKDIDDCRILLPQTKN